MLAIAATMVSFWAIGRYDAIGHGALGLGTPIGHATKSGMTAIAISQTLGFGVLTGALARWRLLPELKMSDALRLAAFISVGFMAALLIVAAFACLVLPAPPWTRPIATLVLLTTALLLALAIWRPHIHLLGQRVTLPSLLAIRGLVFWTFVDASAAAFALFVLLPDDQTTFAVFLPVFFIALGSGLFSGSPGGVGPFDLAILSLLAHIPDAQLLAALVAFRAVYFASPAILGTLILVRPFETFHQSAGLPRSNISGAPRSEVGVIRQNGGFIAHSTSAEAALWDSGQAMCMLTDAITGPPRVALSILKDNASKTSRIPLIYKSSQETSVCARRAGWRVLHIADEAILAPCTFTTDTPGCRRLRRKLRTAQRAGVSVHPFYGMNWSDLATIDTRWQQENGPAKGGTMGRFEPGYLSYQQVFVAKQAGQICGFASFHHSTQEWCLDLMRLDPSAPDGTMQAIVTFAIEQAARAAVPRFSLAAVPACPDPHSAIWRWISLQISARTGGPGLRQFKSSFAPKWQPLYTASPTRIGLVIALCDIARHVHHPPPLANVRFAHKDHDGYELASSRAA